MAMVNPRMCACHSLDSLYDQVVRCGVWIATCFLSSLNGRQAGSNGTGCLPFVVEVLRKNYYCTRGSPDVLWLSKGR